MKSRAGEIVLGCFVVVALCLASYIKLENDQLKQELKQLRNEYKVLSSAYKMKTKQIEDLQK